MLPYKNQQYNPFAVRFRSSLDANGTMVSISIALKDALLGALMNHDPTAKVWRKRLVEGLTWIGAANAAEKVIKRSDKQAERDKRCDEIFQAFCVQGHIMLP